MRAGVIGHPIAHSLSPVLHSAAYRVLGLDWSFTSHDVTADQVAGFVAGLGGQWRGIAATMPCKAALATLGVADELVALVGGANTLVISDGERIVRNTDVPGAVTALARAGITEVGEATIIGNGATARSVMVALARIGCREVTVLAREPARANHLGALGERLGVRVSTAALANAGQMGSRALLVSTIPAVGVAERVDSLMAGVEAVFDVSYDPWPTPLGRAASLAGVSFVGGLDLLAAQAAEQVKLMTGTPVEVDVLLAAGWAELGRRGLE